MSSAVVSERKKLRAEVRRRRLVLSEAQQRLASERLLLTATPLREYRRAKRVAMFLSNDGEINLAALMQHAQAHGKEVYVPMLYRARVNRLLFARVEQHTQFVRNKFDILEPKVPVRQWRKAIELDLIFVPLVAFDEHGNRIGMGGGFYDRTLATLAHKKHWNRPKLIGIAHDCQRVDKIESQSWDIPLPAIVTDKQYYQKHI